MSIRVRTIKGRLIALCAARSMAEPGDLYLDDAVHHALASKFTEDFMLEGGLMPVDPEDARLRLIAESNNPNREWWDRTYGSVALPGEAETP